MVAYIIVCPTDIDNRFYTEKHFTPQLFFDPAVSESVYDDE